MNPWLTPFATNKSKSPKWIEQLLQHNVKTPFDFLWILPNKYLPIIEEKNIFSLADLQDGNVLKITGKIQRAFFKPLFFRKQKPLLHHAFASLLGQKYQWQLQGFNLYPQVMQKWKNWEASESITLIGIFHINKGKLTLSNPKEEIQNSIHDKTSKDILITYPSIKGINSAQWKKIFESVTGLEWKEFPPTPEQFMLSDCFKVLHGISKSTALDESQAIKNLKLYELWCEQMIILKKKALRKNDCITPLILPPTIDLYAKAPWKLTEEQHKSLEEIMLDLQRPYPMRRLLQGEVGSGKTILAFLSALAVIQKNPCQVVIIAPTETLARQHFEKWKLLFPLLKDECVPFYASLPAKDKKNILLNIHNGSARVIIGTHALFQNDVIYKNLRYVIVDEQHRFGVEQRKALYNKGKLPHVLMMSATPIPRTLGLTHFGDLDQSIMYKTPFGEKKIKTRLVTEQHFSKYLEFLKTRLNLGEQIYVVAPVIEESEHFTYHIKYLEEFFTTHFSNFQCTLLHGQLHEQDQKRNFSLFQEGKAAILIATTMVEVGIDVGNATVMCIYHPEQFGLSSLHQLRGRVGRSNKSGFCFLVAPYKLEIDAKERLEFFEQTLDGFILAEKDSYIRGQGNLWGLEQSGNISPYKIARLPEDMELLLEANTLAQELSQALPVFPSHLKGHFPSDEESNHWL